MVGVTRTGEKIGITGIEALEVIGDRYRRDRRDGRKSRNRRNSKKNKNKRSRWNNENRRN